MSMNEIILGLTWPEIVAGAVVLITLGLAFALALQQGGKATSDD